MEPVTIQHLQEIIKALKDKGKDATKYEVELKERLRILSRKNNV